MALAFFFENMPESGLRKKTVKNFFPDLLYCKQPAAKRQLYFY